MAKKGKKPGGAGGGKKKGDPSKVREKVIKGAQARTQHILHQNIAHRSLLPRGWRRSRDKKVNS